MKLAPIFTHHAVLPANKPLPVWGEGRGNITVTLDDVSRTAAAKDGRFFVVLPPMPCGGPHMLSVTSDEEDGDILLFDIHAGLVCLYAGQSNMQFKLGVSNFPADAYENNSALRLYSTARIEAGEPFAPEDGWRTAKEDEIGRWPAIPSLTARRLSEQNPGIAVGVIACYQGASVIESWVPEGAFAQAGITLAPEDKHPDHAHEVYSAWNRDGHLYDFALSQVTPYPLSGIVWYQGESDTTSAEAAVYADELRVLINVWRRDFGDLLLPFVIVQIADFDNPHDADGWRALQAAQASVSGSIPRTAVVASADICEHDDIHPKSKEQLSMRIADALGRLLS